MSQHDFEELEGEAREGAVVAVITIISDVFLPAGEDR